LRKSTKTGVSKAGPSQRQLRVAEEIRHVLSGIFGRADFRDPDLADAHITISEVRIGPDLKHATAFFSRLGRSDADALVPALVRATPYLRGQLARALRLRIAPDLAFTPDLALDYAMKIDELMQRPEIARDLQKD
jgi:ribosome-binding factor A